jgi:hypothetical protein
MKSNILENIKTFLNIPNVCSKYNILSIILREFSYKIENELNPEINSC